MAKRRKVELYEILGHRLSSDQAVPDAPDQQEEGLLPLTGRRAVAQRTGREIVFSLDGAFIIFVVGLLLIGTAFFLGYRRGSVEARMEFARGRADTIARAKGEVGLVSPGSEVLATGAVELSAGKFTLRLMTLARTPENMEKLRGKRLTLLANPVIESNHLEVLVFDKGGTGGYSLAVGLFDKRDDALLGMLREYFRDGGAGAATEFGGMAVENADDLGKAL